MTYPRCEQFPKLGYCWLGRACRKIHHFGAIADAAQPANDANVEVGENAKKAVMERKLEAAKRKLKENKNRLRGHRAPEKERPRRVSMEQWTMEEEEFVPTGETGGEFSQQQDFVPL